MEELMNKKDVRRIEKKNKTEVFQIHNYINYKWIIQLQGRDQHNRFEKNMIQLYAIYKDTLVKDTNRLKVKRQRKDIPCKQ